MFPRRLTLILGSLSLALTAACSSTGGPDGAGSGGAVVGSGGTGSGSGGAGVSGGAPGVGGTGTGGAASGGAGVTGGGPGSGGAATGGGSSGGASSGGAPSTGGSGSGGGGAVGPGPSDLPPAPVEANVPKPSGTPGDITVVDWAGFPAAVTYSFDDNDGSQLTYYDQMHAIGGRFTYYLVSNWDMSAAGWNTIFDDGNEIGNHTTDHNCGGIAGAKTALQTKFGKAPTTVAAPNGDDACQDGAKPHAFINREVGPANPVLPLSDTDPFAMNCYIPATGQAAGTYNGNIDQALNQGGWVIYVIHGINPGTSHTFQPVSWDGLQGAIQYSKDHDVWIDTMENVGAYWMGQKVFADATTETNGDSQTWTWVLPANFPTGKYLRVTVEGGTLTQGGTALTWDPHGYYEIALDDLSVTLGP